MMNVSIYDLSTCHCIDWSTEKSCLKDIFEEENSVEEGKQ